MVALDVNTLYSLVRAAAMGAREMCQSTKHAAKEQLYSACVGYPVYVVQYNNYIEMARELFPDEVNYIPIQKLNITLNTAKATWIQYSEFAEMACSSLEVLEAFLKTKLKLGDERFLSLADHIKANLRASIFDSPKDEKDVQNALEIILRAGGWDCTREKEAIPYSAKSFRPDFVITSLNLALEVKLCAEAAKVKRLVDEINADIPAYSSKFNRSLFVIYDLGHIRDEAEFKLGIEANPGVSVIIIKQ
jgi:hypothetical protein